MGWLIAILKLLQVAVCQHDSHTANTQSNHRHESWPLPSHLLLGLAKANALQEQSVAPRMGVHMWHMHKHMHVMQGPQYREGPCAMGHAHAHAHVGTCQLPYLKSPQGNVFSVCFRICGDIPQDYIDIQHSITWLNVAMQHARSSKSVCMPVWMDCHMCS